MTPFTHINLSAHAMVLVSLLADLPGLGVRGHASCPTPGALEAALVGLIAPRPAPETPDAVEILEQGSSVTVRLSSARGEVIGERRLPDRLSCAERARAAAVVVAAWEAHLRGVAAALDSPAAEARAATQPPALPAPPVAPAAMVAAVAPPAARVAAALPSRAPIQIETSAALFASVTASGVAPAGTFELALTRADSPLALGLGAVIVGGHSLNVASGRGVWRRFGGMVELDSVSRWSALALHLHGGAALTAAVVEGQSLPAIASDTVFDPGVIVGLRLAWVARLAPWLGATAVSWPRAHALLVGGSPATAQLPQFEAWLGGGVTFGRGN